MTDIHPLRSPLQRLATAATLALALAGTSAHAGNANVGVSVNISQPGFYGRINIGDQPPPELVYQQPMIIQQSPVAMYQRPIYMHVPPGHYRDWARHCGFYRACGQPVFFVPENGFRNWMRAREERHRAWEYERERHMERREWEMRQERREQFFEDRRGGDRGHDGRGWDHDHDHGHHHGRD